MVTEALGKPHKFAETTHLLLGDEIEMINGIFDSEEAIKHAIVNHRHDNAALQHEYDKNFGLILKK